MAEDFPHRPQTVSVVPNSGWISPGIRQNFTVEYRDLAGADDIYLAEFIIRNPVNNSKDFFVRYNTYTNRVFLHNYVLNAWLPAEGMPVGSGTISNTFGNIDLSGVNVVRDNERLLITWPISLTEKTSGVKHDLILHAVDKDSASSGFNTLGQWIVNRTPSLIPPQINRQTILVNTWYLFDPRYKDLDGRDNLKNLYFLIGFQDKINESVYLRYDNEKEKMYLWKDGQWTPAEGVAPRSEFLLENEFVMVRGPESRVGNFDVKTKTTKWSLQFKPTFKGRRRLFMRAEDIFGQTANGDTGLTYKGWLEIQ